MGSVKCPYCLEKMKNQTNLEKHELIHHFDEYLAKHKIFHEEEKATQIAFIDEQIASYRQMKEEAEQRGKKNGYYDNEFISDMMKILKNLEKQKEDLNTYYSLLLQGDIISLSYEHHFPDNNIPIERKSEAIHMLETLLEIIPKFRKVRKALGYERLREWDSIQDIKDEIDEIKNQEQSDEDESDGEENTELPPGFEKRCPHCNLDLGIKFIEAADTVWFCMQCTYEVPMTEDEEALISTMKMDSESIGPFNYQSVARCPFCNKDFTMGGGITNHTRSAHPSEYRLESLIIEDIYLQWMQFLQMELIALKNNNMSDSVILEFLHDHPECIELNAEPQNGSEQDFEEFEYEDDEEEDEEDENELSGWLIFRYKLFSEFFWHIFQDQDKYIEKYSDVEPETITKIMRLIPSRLLDRSMERVIETYPVEEIKFTGLTKSSILEQLELELKTVESKIEDLQRIRDSFNEQQSIKDSGGFKCPYCTKKIKSKGALVIHKKASHFEKYRQEMLDFMEEQIKILDAKNRYESAEQMKSRGNFMRAMAKGEDLFMAYDHYFGDRIPNGRKNDAIKLLEKILAYIPEYKAIKERCGIKHQCTSWESEAFITKLIENAKKAP